VPCFAWAAFDVIEYTGRREGFSGDTPAVVLVRGSTSTVVPSVSACSQTSFSPRSATLVTEAFRSLARRSA
jgi:hypothetical protein